MGRRALIVGNWKMNSLVESAVSLVDDVYDGLSQRGSLGVRGEVVACPPFTALWAARARLKADALLALGGQNMVASEPGAFTGEICGAMLRDVGCQYVILGHSERRQKLGETDQGVAQKTSAAFRDGLQPIVCLGETLEERQAGRALDVIAAQFDAVVPAVKSAPSPERLALAYEPVWAIGTGQTASTDQVKEVHGALRGFLADRLGAEIAQKVRILYGGSMNPGNAQELLALEDVDGGLIGGAALKAESFLAIVDALPQTH